MQRKSTCAVLLGLSLLSGCENTDGMNKQEIGTGLGLAVGTTVGILLGGDAGGKLLGAVLGATLGGVIGNQFGRLLDEQDMAAIEKETTEALEKAEDGETVTWNNPESGASAKVTPKDTRTVEKKVVVIRETKVAPTPALELIGKPYGGLQDANVRAAPTADAEVVASIGEGEVINAVGKVDGSNWYLIARVGRSIGYVHGSLIEPSTKVAQAQLRQEPVDLDAMEPDDDVVIDTVSVQTQCRTLEFEVTAGDGQTEDQSFEACKAADGAWEI